VTEQQANITLGITRRSLEAVVIHACQHCGAPGVYKADATTRIMYPGCFRQNAHNEPVGYTCPNCGQRRRSNRDLGEIVSSMPRWTWNLILAFKWCLIKLKGAKQWLTHRPSRPRPQ